MLWSLGLSWRDACRRVLETYVPYVTALYPCAGCFLYFLPALWLPMEGKWLQTFVQEQLNFSSMCSHGNHLQESFSVSSEGGCSFVCFIGGQREKQMTSCLKMQKRASLVQIYTQSHFSVFASSVSLADALLFLFRQFLNEYVKELLHLLHWKKHRKQLSFFNVFV